MTRGELLNNYIEMNKTYWEKGYAAPNVDHNAFRFAGRVLKPDFGLPRYHERLLDFGCGQGSAAAYFSSIGFAAHGVDFSDTDISAAKAHYPDLVDQFFICDGKPSNNSAYGDGGKYRVITAIQSLYYFTQEDFHEALEMLYGQLDEGGIFYATMMGKQSKQFFENSVATEDPWLRVVNFSDSRHSVSSHCMFFVDSEDDLKAKFNLFRPLHVGYYAAKYRSDEGDGFHYTFVGQKA